MTSWYKMLKLVTAKKYNTHFVIAEREKIIKTHEKKPKPNICALNIIITNGSTKNLLKANYSRSNTETNLASGAQRWKLSKKNFFANQNCEFFKTKNSTNQKTPKYRLFHAKWRRRDPPHSKTHRHKQFYPQGGKLGMKKPSSQSYVKFYEDYEKCIPQLWY